MSDPAAGKLKNAIIDVLCFTVGCAALAFGVQYFCAPNDISIGGITGLATMINYLTGGTLPIGTMTMVMNVPLFILAWIFLGHAGFTKSLIGTVLSSVLMDFFDGIGIEPYGNDLLLAALLGGVVSGLGVGLIFLRGGTAGGVDIVGRLVKRKLPHIEVGRLILVIEGVLLVGTTVVYHNIENALYSLITIVVYSYMLDMVLYGVDRGKSYFVVSDKPREIAAAVFEQIQRGVTILEGKGAYTDKPKEVLMIALRSNEVVRVRNLIRDIDPSAFIIVCDATEIIGQGFKSIRDDK